LLQKDKTSAKSEPSSWIPDLSNCQSVPVGGSCQAPHNTTAKQRRR